MWDCLYGIQCEYDRLFLLSAVWAVVWLGFSTRWLRLHVQARIPLSTVAVRPVPWHRDWQRNRRRVPKGLRLRTSWTYVEMFAEVLRLKWKRCLPCRMFCLRITWIHCYCEPFGLESVYTHCYRTMRVIFFGWLSAINNVMLYVCLLSTIMSALICWAQFVRLFRSSAAMTLRELRTIRIWISASVGKNAPRRKEITLVTRLFGIHPSKPRWRIERLDAWRRKSENLGSSTRSWDSYERSVCVKSKWRKKPSDRKDQLFPEFRIHSQSIRKLTRRLLSYRGECCILSFW